MPLENNKLHDRKIAILAADGFNESQLFSPKKALEEAGAQVVIISLKEGSIKAWDKDHWGKNIRVDMTVSDCHSDEFDALLIPGGEMNPENLLLDEKVAELIKDFAYEGKSIASICHGTKVLIDTGLAKGKTLTTWHSMKKDLINCGAKFKDDEVVAHKGIVTSRCPTESPKFNRMMIENFSISPRSRKPLLH